MMDQIKKKKLLDEVETKINQGHFSEALSTLYDGLNDIRSHSSKEDWKQFITQYRNHPVSPFFLQEPLAHRAFERPRGYAGDPVMLDLIYDFDEAASMREKTEISDVLYYEFNRLCHANIANRERRCILSEKIDQAAERVANPYILSVASGHLREALDSIAVKNNKIGKFVAIDQDKEALSVAAEMIKDVGETISASVVDIIRNKVTLPRFDYIYSLGVYDYLPDRIAKKLTNKLVDLLNPGGRLLIANYLPNVPPIGFMEAVMDWWLIYRTKEQMQELIEDIPRESINNVDMFIEKTEVILFMEVEKAGEALRGKGDEKNEEK